jgi:hypothetical protein
MFIPIRGVFTLVHIFTLQLNTIVETAAPTDCASRWHFSEQHYNV